MSSTDLILERRFAKIDPFNPLSVPQVKAYIAHRKWPMPLHRTERDENGERKPTTNDESLLELLREGKPAFGDKVLDGVLDARHLSKARSYLSEKYVHPDGRLHPIFTMKPKQRLSSAAPNVMNFPKGKKGEILKEASAALLSSIEADPGYTLFSADWNSLHPALIAHFAGDANYARIARLGDHAFVMSHFLAMEGRLPAPVDLDRPDSVVKAELDALKERFPADYKVCKVANLAYKYLQGVFNMARTTGLTVDKTKKLRAAIDAASPKVAAWRRTVLDTAHFQGRLVSPFSLPLTFFDVYKRGPNGKVELDKEGEPKLGAEAPEASSFFPLATESGMLREVLVMLFEDPRCELRYKPFTALEDTGKQGSFVMLIPEHDKIIGQARDSEVEGLLRELIVPTMNRPWPELDGLRVGVDVEIGKRLMECGSTCAWKAAPVCEAGHMKGFKL